MPLAKKPAKSSVVPDMLDANVFWSKTNAQLFARRDLAVPRGVASAAPIYGEYAETQSSGDVEGNSAKYRFASAALGVLNTGPPSPQVIGAAKAQEDASTSQRPSPLSGRAYGP